MHSAVHDMLNRYLLHSADDYREALREIIQEITLLGLYRANFFKRAAFYGGTALRIFYGLDRFSEDLDFSLYEPDQGFDLSAYLHYVEDELRAFGFEVEVSKKEKRVVTAVESAFVKAGTKIHLLKVGCKDGLLPEVAAGEKLKVKFEVDINPAGKVDYEVKYHLRPLPFNVPLFKPSYLFAGKVHALLCRQWGGKRVKGRDLYDYQWFISRDIPVTLSYLAVLLEPGGQLISKDQLDRQALVEMLQNKFSAIDFRQAVNDVVPFVKNRELIALWSKDFFQKITQDKLKIEK